MDSFAIGGARPSQLDALMDFYTSDERDTLPAPSYSTLKDALAKQSLLVVIGPDQSIVATAGYFEYARSNDDYMIYELAGTRVKNAVGRLTGFSLQQILIALRVVQVAATEQGPISLISSAKSLRSIANLRRVALDEIEPMPAWFAYDTCSWTSMADRQNWKHFVATSTTLDVAIGILQHVRLDRGEYTCMATQKRADDTIVERLVRLRFEQGLVGQFRLLAFAHRASVTSPVFAPLPASI